ncbi:hypothetical protein M426DRAFT_138668 [Hypoxylon sp. CI-4A]|nr:hypothetical protein M426DRAFT_138668 [Hypoxylon sp. CI-4A]
MDAIRTFWPHVVGTVDNVKELIQDKALSKFISKQSVGTLVARGTRGQQNAIAITISHVLLYCTMAINIVIAVTLSYTLTNIFPVLAIVEDDAPPSYEAVSDKEPIEGEFANTKGAFVNEGSAPQARPRPVTSSLRSIYRTLTSLSGKKSLFRGARCSIVYMSCLFTLSSLISQIPFIPVVVSLAIAGVLTSPIYTAWTHIIISEPSEKTWWHRVPRYGPTVRATALPTLAFYLVNEYMNTIARNLTAALIGGRIDSTHYAGYLLYVAIYLLALVFVNIPIHITLTRVQASLLPIEERTIVPLDRGLTFSKADGREYMSIREAWRTFTRASWIRLVKLYVKIYALCSVVYLVMGSIAFFEAVVVPMMAKA